MAKPVSNPFAGVVGRIGRLVFYYRNGKPCVRQAPTRTSEPTPAEQHNHSRFRLASIFASAVLKDPVQSARYTKAAKQTDGSAQNLAVSDFLLSPTVKEIDLSRYSGRAGEFIKITVEEGKIGATGVEVLIAD